MMIGMESAEHRVAVEALPATHRQISLASGSIRVVHL